MKSSVFDYLLSSLILMLITVTSGALAFEWLQPVTKGLAGTYSLLLDGLVFLLAYGVLSGLLVRICLKIKPLPQGNFGMEEGFFVYWKLITVVHEFGRGALLPFATVFAKPLISSLFGAKMGSNIAMGGMIVDPWFVEIGDNAVLGLDSAIVAHAITSGQIILKSVKISDGVTIGVHAVIMAGVTIGQNSIVAAGAVVPMNTQIPPNELWAGIPARKVKDITATDVRG